MTTNPVEPLNEPQARQRVADIITRASMLTITDTESAYYAREMRREAWLINNHAEKHFKTRKAPFQEPLKAINAEEKEICAPCDQALELLDPKIIAYEEEEERRRGDLLKKLQEQARSNAQQARDAKIAQLEKDGRQNQADELRLQPLYVPPIVLPASENFLEGEGRSQTWGVEEATIDLIELAKAVIAGQLPANVLAPNVTALNNMAKALKTSGQIPGCKIIPIKKVTQRS